MKCPVRRSLMCARKSQGLNGTSSSTNAKTNPRSSASRNCARFCAIWGSAEAAVVSSLYDFLPKTESPSNDVLLGGFLGYVESRGLQLYPAQESAILELFEEKNVVL